MLFVTSNINNADIFSGATKRIAVFLVCKQ